MGNNGNIRYLGKFVENNNDCYIFTEPNVIINKHKKIEIPNKDKHREINKNPKKIVRFTNINNVKEFNNSNIPINA